jgi:hypothetical protein
MATRSDRATTSTEARDPRVAPRARTMRDALVSGRERPGIDRARRDSLSTAPSLARIACATPRRCPNREEWSILRVARHPVRGRRPRRGPAARKSPASSPPVAASVRERALNRDHGCAAGVDGVDDLGVVDALYVDRGDAEVGVPELALDDDPGAGAAARLSRIFRAFRQPAPPKARAVDDSSGPIRPECWLDSPPTRRLLRRRGRSRR